MRCSICSWSFTAFASFLRVCVCSRSLTAFALSGQLYEPDFNTNNSCLHIVIANVLSSTYT